MAEPTIHWTEGKLKLVSHAKRAEAAEELAEIFLGHAARRFRAGDYIEAVSLSAAANLCTGWAENERELQADLEKIHGRYNG